MTQQFHSQVSAQEKCEPVSTEKGEHALAALFVRALKWKHPGAQPMMNGQGECGIHMMTWPHPENMLSLRSQTQKTICYTIPRMRNIQKRQIRRDRRDMSGCLQLEEMEGRVMAQRNRVSFWKNKKFSI